MEIDQRVVEMQFDNKHFESNVSTTMSTLDKLKQKLHFSDSAKGLEDVGNAAKNVDMNGLSNGVETARLKFSALQVMGITALTNITNKAVDAGQRIVSALTIDPIKAGFNEYELKMDSVKTIVNSTGRDLEDVNKLLEELNEYSDQTIYSFQDMTQNIGKFTNAGVKLEDAVLAIKGISNEAAVSGASAAEASRAMYNFSQALSAGHVKLIDWKSIENANMATVEFKQQLIDTAVELGVVTKAGEDYKTSAGHAFNATKNFNDVLKDEWMTTDVLIKTLGKYADANTDIGKKAFKAAQDVTKMSQMWDVLKETAQSGWAKTWEIIFGDLEQAKAFFTPLTNAISGFIQRIDDARNRVLEIALNFTKPWKAISEKLGKIGDIVKPVEGAIKALGDYQDIVTKVWRGDYNNWGDNPDRRDLLKAAGYDYMVVQELVNLGYGYKLTAEDIAAAQKKYGYSAADAVMTVDQLSAAMEDGTLTMAQLDAALENGTISLKDYNKLSRSAKVVEEELSDAKLEKLGLTEEEIRLYRALEKEAKKQGVTMKQLTKEMSEQTGRERLIEGLKNLGKAIGDVFSVAKASYREIFNPPSVEELGIRLFGVIRTFQKWTETLKGSIFVLDEEGKATDKLTDTGEKLKRTFKGIFAVFHTVYTILSGPLKIAFNLIKGILSAFDIPILDFTAGLGDILVQLDELITGFLDFEKIGKNIGLFFKNFGKNMGSLWKSFKESKVGQALVPIFKAIGDAIMRVVNAVKQTEAFKSIVKFFQPFLDGIKSWWDGLKEAENIPKYLFEGLWKGITKGASLIWNGISTVIVKLIDIVCDILGIHSPSVVFMTIGGFIIAGLVSGITKAFPQVGEAFGGLFNKLLGVVGEVDFGSMLAVALGLGTAETMHNVSKGLAGVGELMSGASEFLVEIAPGVNKTLKGCGKFVKDVGKGLKAIGKGIKADLKAEAFQKRMDGIMTLVQALILLAAAVVILGKITTTEELIRGGIAIVVLAGVLVLLAWAVNKFSKSSLNFDKATGKLNIDGIRASVLGIGLALLAMAAAMKILGGMAFKDFMQGIAGVIMMMAAVTAMLVIIGKTVKGKTAQNISKFGGMMLKMALALILMVWVIKLASGLSGDQLIKGITFLAIFSVFVLALTAISKLGGHSLNKMGGMMFTMSLTLILMVLVFKLAAGLDSEEMARGIEFLVIFGAFVLALVAIAKIGGVKSLKGLSGMLVGVSIAMLAMVLVIKLAGSIPLGQMMQGLVVVVVLGLLIKGLITACGSGTKVKGMMGTLLAVTIAIGILAVIATLLGLVEIWQLTKGVTAVSVLAGMMAILIKSLRGAAKVTGTIFAIAIAIAIMAAAVYVLSGLDGTKVAIATGAMSALMGMFTVVIKSSSKASKTIKVLLVITGAIAVMAGIIYLLASLPVESVLGSATALSMLMGVLAGVLLACSKVSTSTSNVMKAVGALSLLGLVVAEIAVILGLMDLFNVNASIDNVTALSVLISVMAGVLLVCSNVKANEGKVTKAVGAMTLLGLVVAEIAAVLSLMDLFDVNASIDNVTALSVLITIMTGVLFACSKIKVNEGRVMKAVGAMAVLGLVVAEIAAIFGLMQLFGINASIETAIALSTVMVAMSAACLITSMIPISGAVTGAAGLVAFVAIVGALIAALGALSTIPGFDELMSGGVEVMGLIGYGIGNFVGSIVGGVAAGVSSGLPKIGANLSAFMENAEPFIDAVTKLNPKSMEGIGALAEAILIIAGASILDALSSIFGGGESSLASFGKQLGQLGGDLRSFSDSLGGFSDSELTTVTCAANAIKMLAQAAQEIPNEGGWLAAIVGDNSISQWGGYLPDLGTNIAGFATNLGTFDDDKLATVECAASAIKSLAQAAQEIPNEGGWLAAIVGDNSISQWGGYLPDLGSNIAGFGTNLGTFTDAEVATVECAANAIKALAIAAQEIPNEGGWLAAIVGDNSISQWGGYLPDLGSNLSGFAKNLGTFTNDEMVSMEFAAKAVAAMAIASQSISGQAEWCKKLFGDDSIESFASQLPTVGTYLAGFATNLGTFTSEEGATVTCAAQAISAMALASKDIDGQADWCKKLFGDDDIDKFAEKLPTVGTYLQQFATNLGEFGDGSVTTVTCASQAIKSMSEASTSIDGQADWCKKLFGDDDIDKFAYRLPVVGTYLKEFAANLGEFGDSSVATVTCASDAIKSMAEASTYIDGQAGWTKAFCGDDGIDAFAKALPDVGTGLNGFIKNIGSFSSDDLTTVRTAVKALIDMIDIMTVELNFTPIELIGYTQLMDELALAFVDFIAKMPETISIGTAITKIKQLLGAIDDIANVNSDGLEDFADALGEYGDGAVGKFILAFTNDDAKTNVKTAVESLAKGAAEGLKSEAVGSSVKTAATYLVTGYTNGVNNKTTRKSAYDAGYAIGAEAVKGINAGQKSGSPSILAKQAGNWLGEGYTIGINQWGSTVERAGYDLGDTGVEAMSSSIAKIAEAINTDVECDPVIRPVLDLSDVQSGASAIGNLLGLSPSIGVSGNLGSITSMMNAKSQNGGNDDLISEIEKLRAEMKNMNNTTYNINGVTYDDGSNISNAVKTIVRYAKIEGRV